MLTYVGVIDQFSIRDGLPDMRIECVHADDDGMIWIGTHARGLVAYDGDRFQEIRSPDEKFFGVYAILRDGEGWIWLASDSGLYRVAGESLEPVDGTDGLSFLWGADVAPDGRKWLGLGGEPGLPPRVFWHDGVRGEVCELAGNSEAGCSVNSVLVAANGDIWCGGDGLYRIDGASGRVETLASPRELQVTAITRATDGDLLLATHAGLQAIGADGAMEGILDPGVEAVGTLDGRVWATDRHGSLTQMEGREIRKEVLLGVPLWRAIDGDLHGRIWLGSYGFGLFCYDETGCEVADSSTGLSVDHVNAVSDASTTVWVGTAGGLVDGETGRLPELRGDVRDLDSVGVTSLVVDASERLWVGKRSGVVYVIDGVEVVKAADVATLHGHSIDSMILDHEGAIWCGSAFATGHAVYADVGSVEVVEGGQRSSPRPTRIGALAQGLDGTVYLGTADSRDPVSVVACRGECVEVLTDIQVRPVTALCVDLAGRLWVGGNDGVVVHDDEYVISLGLEDGLSSELVTSLFCDSAGRVWIGTEGGGASVYDGRVFQTLYLDRRPYCNSVNAIAESADGKLWFATNGGIIRRSLRSADVSVRVEGVLADVAYADVREVQFPDTVGRIVFSVAGVSQRCRSERLVFRYRLAGFDSDWRQTGEREISYPRLDAGSYEFQVQAVDVDLNYSPLVKVQCAVVADPRIDALNQALRSEVAQGEYVGNSTAMREVITQVQEVAWTDLTVLILGETGTGKGLAARRLHELSERRDGPFIHVNCGAVQETLIDSELFGHERGAFTSAVSRRLGKFELAQGGTIFLDEIGDLPLESQARLLKVLQDHTIERVGGADSISVDVRIVAATNRDLGEAVRVGKFRDDLFYRLNVFPIRVPPLRERLEDLPDLASHFVQVFAAHLSRPTPILDPAASQSLLEYEWPGNVRELEHAMQRAVLLAKGGVITPDKLGFVTADSSANVTTASSAGPIVTLVEYEKQYFTRVLAHTGGVIHGERGAAKLLGMKPTTLRSRLEKLGIKPRRRQEAP